MIKDQLVSYLRSEYSSFNSHNKLDITIDHEAEPWLGDPENDAFRTLEEAVMDVWSEGNEERVRPLYIREGGSIPTARFLEKEFGAPAAHLPCGQASDQAHLDDERLRLVNLYKVCLSLFVLPKGFPMYTIATGLIRVGYFRARRSSRGCLRSYRRSRRIYFIFYHVAIECCDWLERSGEGGGFLVIPYLKTGHPYAGTAVACLYTLVKIDAVGYRAV